MTKKEKPYLKSDLAPLAVHQFKTSLTLIKWSLEMILNESFGKINKTQQDVLQKSYLEIEKLLYFIYNILNIDKIDSTKYFYNPTLCDIEGIVESVVDLYRYKIIDKNINFVFQKPAKKIGKILLDATAIRVAIQNLFDNAIKYTNHSGSVAIALEGDGKEIKFSIKDSGMGIPAKENKKIFDNFFRGANAIKTKTAGSGFGLFIVKRIIEAHGGKIWFESKENEGSIFYFTLPMQK